MNWNLVTLSAFLFPSFAIAQNIDVPVLITRTVDRVYAPVGFDDNDNVEVILHGHYQTSCYTNGPVTADVDVDNKSITIKAESYLHLGAPCRQMAVPFIQPLKLGLLKPGTYSIRIEGNSQTLLSPLVIKAAETESQDDYMYPAVSAAFITRSDSGIQSLNLVGIFPKVSIGCLMLKKVKLSHTPGQVLVVQPIMELRDGWTCHTTAAQPQFTYSQELSVTLSNDELIHVRSANGESVNSLFVAP